MLGLCINFVVTKKSLRVFESLLVNDPSKTDRYWDSLSPNHFTPIMKVIKLSIHNNPDIHDICTDKEDKLSIFSRCIIKSTLLWQACQSADNWKHAPFQNFRESLILHFTHDMHHWKQLFLPGTLEMFRKSDLNLLNCRTLSSYEIAWSWYLL